MHYPKYDESCRLAKQWLAGNVKFDTMKQISVFMTALAKESVRQHDSEGSGWISIEDAFPEPMIDVLAYIDGHSGKFEDVVYFRNDGSWSELYDVTHWQPLPSPPQTDKEGER